MTECAEIVSQDEDVANDWPEIWPLLSSKTWDWTGTLGMYHNYSIQNITLIFTDNHHQFYSPQGKSKFSKKWIYIKNFLKWIYCKILSDKNMWNWWKWSKNTVFQLTFWQQFQMGNEWFNCTNIKSQLQTQQWKSN